MTTKDVLTAARAFIEEGWTKGYYACDEDGSRQWPTSIEACSWCAVGSLYATLGIHKDDRGIPNKSFDDALNFLNGIAWNFGKYVAISDFNDDRKTTQANMLALFDKAIKETDNDN